MMSSRIPTDQETFAGIDVGGANIKFATTSGDTREIEFPIWKDKSRLHEILANLAESIPPNSYLGVTMTAELADCFENKRNGVAFIAQAVTKAFPKHHPLFYLTDGTFCDASAATSHWRLAAASNWHALARLAFDSPIRACGFVFDIGSTTCDIIPVKNGIPVIEKQQDFDRLSNAQLTYAGVGRTPVCSLAPTFQLGNRSVSTARELFATTADAFIWLDRVPEEHNKFATADGRSASKKHSGQRLARMVCADLDDLEKEDVDQIAEQTANALTNLLSQRLACMLRLHPDLPQTFVTFGKGAWLANEIVRQVTSNQSNKTTQVISFSKFESVNQTAPAYAVALFRQRFEHSLRPIK